MTFDLQNIFKHSKLTTGLIKLAFVIALFCSSDVVWHTESRLPEVAQTELAISNSTPPQEDNSVHVSFNKVAQYSGTTFNASNAVFYVEQQHTRILNTRFYNLKEKRNLFTPVLFLPIRLSPTEKSNTRFLSA